MRPAFNSTTTSMPDKPLIKPPLFVPGVEPWQMALLVATGLASIAAYAPVTVATYRVSRSLHPFILFFSEGLANMHVLIVFTIAYAGQLLLTPLHAEALINALMCSPLLYSGLLHYPLIAVNRGAAIFFPLYYDRLWDRRTIVTSVRLVWVASMGLGAPNLLRVPYTFTNLIYCLVMLVVTYSSLAIYAAALTWVLLSRVVLFVKRSSQVADAALALDNPDITQTTDLRVFAYCLVSFLPNCYSMVVKPPLNSLHFQYYAIARPASAGLLLFVMSTVTREQTPGLPQLCRPHSTVVPLQTTNHRNTQQA